LGQGETPEEFGRGVVFKRADEILAEKSSARGPI
jgi:hypothetical protein